MSVPYSVNLSWNNYTINPHWHVTQEDSSSEETIELIAKEEQAKKAISDIFNQVFKQSWKRGIEFLRHSARSLLKTPIRLIYSSIVEKDIWKQLERASINGKLVLYSFVQLVSVPVKFLVALVALGILPFSGRKAKWLQDQSENWTKNIDGRMSKLEALKEEGLKNAKDSTEFFTYKKWIEQVHPHLCR